MKEITFVCPTSKLTRTIKVCETQKELINVIHERRSLKNGYVYVIYKNGGYFYQLLGSSGYKVNQFKRYGISSATVSSPSGELFVFGDFDITVEPSCYYNDGSFDYNVICSEEPEAAIRFALYLLGR